MTPILRRRAAATLCALALGTGLAACGSNTGSTHTGAPVWPGVGGTAPAAPAAAGGSTPGGSAPPATGSVVDAATISAKMQRASAVTTSAHETMSMMAAGQRVDAVGDVTTRPVAADFTMSLMGMSMEARLVGDTFYIKPPAAAGLHGKWLKMTSDELAAASGIGGLASMSDPLAMLKRTESSIRSARYLGTDATGQHYTIKVDTAKMLQAMGASGQRLGQMGATLPPTASEDVWFDSAGHIVKTTSNLGMGGVSTVRLSRFGEQVHVAAPPADQVEDLSSLGGLGGVGGLGNL